MKELEGKTIEKIEEPDSIVIDGRECYDHNIIITFIDGTILKLASWDHEGYRSGIYREIIKPL